MALKLSFAFFSLTTSNSLYSQTLMKTRLWGPCKKKSFEGGVRPWFEQVRMQMKEIDKETKIQRGQ